MDAFSNLAMGFSIALIPKTCCSLSWAAYLELWLVYCLAWGPWLARRC